MSGQFRGKSRFALVLCCCMAAVLSVSAPANPGVQKTEGAQGSFNLRVDVELVTTEVVVLDKKGKPVPNLKKENFRLFEDGKEQTIASFDEVAETADPLKSGFDEVMGRGKIVLILFDDSTIPAKHLKKARDSAERFIEEHMMPPDLFAVASFGTSMKVLQSFTRDREKILQAIRLPAVSSAGVFARQNALQTPLPLPSGGRQESEQRSLNDASVSDSGAGFQAENLLRALQSLSMSVERLKGQKSILLYSESGYFNQNTIQTYSKTLNSAKRSSVVVFTIDPGGLDSSDIGESRRQSEPVRRPAGFSMKNMVQSFQNTGGGGTGGGTGGGGGGTSGGGTGTTGGATGGSSTGSSDFAYPKIPDSDNSFSSKPTLGRQSHLKSLAAETGGLAIFNTNDFDDALDKVNLQLSNYYVLGFLSNNPKHDGQFRDVEIRTDLKGVSLKYRKSYLDRRPVDLLANSKQEKTLLNAMVSPDTAARIPIVFRSAYFYDSPRMARVIISTKIRTDKVEMKKKGGDLTGVLNLMGVAYGEDGTVAARFSDNLQLAVPRDKETEFRKATVSYRNYFKLRPGKYRLKLAASDEASNLGSIEQMLELPPLPESGMAGSSLVVADQMVQLPDLIRNIQTRLLDETQVLVFSGLQIFPSVENKLPVGTPVPVFFKLYRFGGTPGQAKITARAKLRNEKGEELLIPSIPLEQNISRTSDVESAVGVKLPFERTAPGKYILTIEASDWISAKPVIVQTDIEYI